MGTIEGRLDTPGGGSHHVYGLIEDRRPREGRFAGDDERLLRSLKPSMRCRLRLFDGQTIAIVIEDSVEPGNILGSTIWIRFREAPLGETEPFAQVGASPDFVPRRSG